MSDGFGVINWKVWHTFGTPSWWLDYHGDDNEDYDSELLMMTMLNPSEIFNVLMTVMIVNCKDYKLNWIIYLERKLPIRHFHCDDGSSFENWKSLQSKGLSNFQNSQQLPFQFYFHFFNTHTKKYPYLFFEIMCKSTSDEANMFQIIVWYILDILRG